MEDSINVDAPINVDVGMDGCDEDSEMLVPKPGMVFKSQEELKSFYKTYSSKKGFGVKIRNSKKGLDGEVFYFILACSREGCRKSKIPSSLKTLPTKEAKCKAKITARKGEGGQWCIKKVVLDHNHDVSPTKSRMFTSNKSLSLHVKRTIELNDRSGVRITKTFQTLVQESGGYENLSFGERDVRNYIRKQRRVIGKDGDAKALIEYFANMKEENKEFWYEIDLDDGFHVRNIFWADARSRAAYEYFGDVVSFDTTYLTNKYEMPFATFVGVNHHGQSVLLGCGLLSAEDTESFVWLFDSWVRCMSGKPPSGLVTDQCKAMQKGIEEVMPNTRHRWCLWHIMKKIPEKLRGYGEYKKIKSCMKEAVYETLTREEFDDKWASFVKEYQLEENNWLGGLFNNRHKWVPIYLKNNFWAGLSTTQRSESINAFFDGYVNSKTSLQQFVMQYDNALKSRVEKEVEADFQSMSTMKHCGSNSPIEKQFQEEYTLAKFGEIQDEFRGKINCVPCFNSLEGTIATFDVIEEVIVFDRPKESIHKVVFNRANHDVSCQCLLFEFRGIMCRHSLCVLSFERIKEVPTKYILARWSKKIKRRHAYIKSSYDAAEFRPNMERFDKMVKHFYEVTKKAADSDARSNLVHRTIEKLHADLQSMPSSLTNFNTYSDGNDSVSKTNVSCSHEHIEVHNPLHSPHKGRPSLKRKMSQVEKAIQKCKKQNTKKSQKMHVKESVEATLNREGGSNFSIELCVEVECNGNLIGERPMLEGVGSGNRVAVTNYEDNYLGTQYSNVQQGGFVSMLESYSQGLGVHDISFTSLLVSSDTSPAHMHSKDSSTTCENCNNI